MDAVVLAAITAGGDHFFTQVRGLGLGDVLELQVLGHRIGGIDRRQQGGGLGVGLQPGHDDRLVELFEFSLLRPVEEFFGGLFPQVVERLLELGEGVDHLVVRREGDHLFLHGLEHAERLLAPRAALPDQLIDHALFDRFPTVAVSEIGDGEAGQEGDQQQKENQLRLDRQAAQHGAFRHGTGGQAGN